MENKLIEIDLRGERSAWYMVRERLQGIDANEYIVVLDIPFGMNLSLFLNVNMEMASRATMYALRMYDKHEKGRCLTVVDVRDAHSWDVEWVNEWNDGESIFSFLDKCRKGIGEGRHALIPGIVQINSIDSLRGAL
jgi:hypothetical protein